MIARVFPRKTVATPTDQYVFFDAPPLLDEKRLADITEVHVSVSFTYDMKKADWLERQWKWLGWHVNVGGPAFNEKGGEFIPGLYLKKGYLITSRGCPNNCWFCAVPKREGGLRELDIKDGYNILDDNFLACSEQHILQVFEMLKRQKNRPEFTGGLESKILKPWHCQLLADVKTKRMYFAYDTPDDYEPLHEAGKLLRQYGFDNKGHELGCYCLIGYPKDTYEQATERLNNTIKAGFMPYAMLYKDKNGNTDKTWRRFQREWCNPTIVGTKMKP